jgi:hypothetical protein
MGWRDDRTLDDYLRGRLKAALDELSGLAPDYLLSENEDVLIATLLETHLPTPIVVNWDGATRTPVSEVTVQVRDEFERDRVYTVPASKIVLSFPVTGTSAMLGYRASTFSWGPKHGSFTDGAIVLEVAERTLTPEVIRNRVDQLTRDIDQRVSWVNSDLRAFAATTEQSLRRSYRDRTQRILNDRSVEAALGIPVVSSGAARQPVPAHRRQVALEGRRHQATFVPEPTLDEAIYRDVLEVVRSWARSLERTPKTADKLEEEELRDLLLGTLNGYWRGAAGGELFNGSGKTDILIRAEDRNAFIAECKIWRGSKSITDAVIQLLSYLVWRDSKAALVIFIKTVDPAATIEKLHAAIQSHPRHVLTNRADDPSKQVDYVMAADDEGRRVSLAVMPVVIRASRDDDEAASPRG